MPSSCADLVTECDRLGIHGLLFQHIHLCPTRTWLHYHRIDCTHLNRHMQTGLFLHATTYGGRGAQADFGFGLAPDTLDFQHCEISEIKKSSSHEHATIAQLCFYLAVMEHATERPWTGVLRYPASLALDLAEIFKPVLADKIIFGLGNRQMVHDKDFEEADNACRLTEAGRRQVVDSVREKVDLEQLDDVRGYRTIVLRKHCICKPTFWG